MTTTQDCVIQVSYLSDKCDTSSVVAIKGKVITDTKRIWTSEFEPEYIETESFTDAHGNELPKNAIVWGHKLI